MQPYAYQLRDIHGLDPTPWWPPAPGWWLLAFGLILTLWLWWRFFPRLKIPALSGIGWRWDASRRLRELRRRVDKQDPKQSATELSELLRRIAMARFGRNVCAGLTGAEWLQWLHANDPRGYDWSEQGQLLLSMPYAPPGQGQEHDGRLRELIDAAQNWVTRQEKREPQQEAQTDV
jgi:hypothetical protein